MPEHLRGKNESREGPLLGRFIADFYAPAGRLVIEVDGGYHAGRVRADQGRDAVLVRAGYRVLRLDAALVVGDIEAGLACVCEARLWATRRALHAAPACQPTTREIILDAVPS